MLRFIKEWTDFYNKIKDDSERSGLSEQEAYALYAWIYATKNLEGEIAEFGVYRGWSAKVMCEANKTNKKVYLFDTFTGMPLNLVDAKLDSPYCNTGKHHNLTSIYNVEAYLQKYKNIYFMNGLFSKTIKTLNYEKFSFVHLDCDIYQSTLQGLEYFYPRLVKGGILISHNYQTPTLKTDGVKAAFIEYFANNKNIVTINETQGMVVK